MTFSPRTLRWLAASLGVSMALQPVLTTAAFRDVSGSPYATAIGELQADGILVGYEDGSYKPNATINRAEFLKIIAASQDLKAGTGNCFPDVKNEWFAGIVCDAKAKGIVAGYPDGLFHPERDISFVEAAKILTLAYKIDPAQIGSEWYEKYARALDSSKAIPLTIDRLERKITRGEMAEMMWRLKDGITDRPTKGYLNVKRPEIGINLASDDIQNAKSCTDLQALAEESRGGSMDMYYGRGGALMEGDAASPTAPTAAQNKAGVGGGSDGDYSQTNVQVLGVDEADMVKTDGEYIYMVREQTVRIVKATPANGLKEMAVIDLQKESVSPTDLYLDGSKLIIMGQHWEQIPYPRPLPAAESMKIAPGYYPPYYSKPRAVVMIYDVSNRSAPKLSREVKFDGTTVSSRKIEDKVYLVLQQPMFWAYPMPMLRAIPEADLLPNFQDSAEGGKDQPVTRCGSVMVLPHPVAPEYITVATIPLGGNTQEVKHEVVVGSAQSIYASLENLYVAMTEWNYQWDAKGSQSSESTNVYRFAFTDDGVDFKADGEVPGHILNQFSMDEHENTFRIATTINQNWSNPESVQTNNLFILNMNMDTVGSVKDLAPGEQIYSTRFMGDRAYMVTFRQVDPLFVIDTSDPRNPKVLGKLKIPGYSNYLHPYDETHLIGFGKDAVASKDNNFAWYQGLKIALFDVTDPENPKEMSTAMIGDRGSDSPLLYDHKALLFDKERGILSFPVMVAELTAEQKKQNDDGSQYGSPVYQGAVVFDISLKNGLKERGRITQYDDPDTFKKAGDYWYNTGRDVQRVLRIGENLYTTSNAAVYAHNLSALNKLGSVELSGTTDVKY